MMSKEIYKDMGRDFLGEEWNSFIAWKVECGWYTYSDTTDGDPTVEISVNLADCSRRVHIDEFGRTREEAQAKVQIMIDRLLDLKLSIDAGYDAKEAFVPPPKKEKKKDEQV